MNALIRSSRLEDMPTDSGLAIGRSSLASGCIGANTNASSPVQKTIAHTRLTRPLGVFSPAGLTLAAMKTSYRAGLNIRWSSAYIGRIFRCGAWAGLKTGNVRSDYTRDAG